MVSNAVYSKDSTPEEVTSTSPYLFVGAISFEISEEKQDCAQEHSKMETGDATDGFNSFPKFRSAFYWITMLDDIHGSTSP